ncbi:unnamed protein product [Ectocarpus sp. CCAP 1310/34]|nr:unnamed protein product [Ectocarpus sp. CCAP 1310/34]
MGRTPTSSFSCKLVLTLDCTLLILWGR